MINIFLLGGGIILLYSGVKGYNPVTVIKDALAGKDNPGDDFALPDSDPLLSNPLIPGGNAEEFFNNGSKGQPMPEENTGSAQV